jgi:hypothetical protein
MTRERAEQFGAAWNSGNADLVASYFTDDGAYHASPMTAHIMLQSVLSHSERATSAKTISVARCRLFSTGFPTENSKT